jgi:proteasome assembly chaperone (PAC2) family protein
MKPDAPELLRLHRCPTFRRGTLVLALTGWMDGGDVSTGTVRRLVELLDAQRIAEIDSDPFYIYNAPGSMEVAALFRPHVEIAEGLVRNIELPTNIFYAHDPASLVLFIGREPNLRWRMFGECLFALAQRAGVRRILFVGSFGGAVPHTRQPRLHVTCSETRLLPEMTRYGLRPTRYEGPGSFTSYLLTEAAAAGFEMSTLVAEIPGYLQGTNLASIEAVLRRLAKILQLPLDLAPLRVASTEWELEISSLVDENEALAETVHRLEEAYDNELLEQEADGR